ncbi:MAG: hypothetical protein ACOZD0_06985 [Pseudomonadota bacterium]
MEEPVGQHLGAQVQAAAIQAHGAQQVVPLQDLVQQDAVEESAQGEAEPSSTPAGHPAGPVHAGRVIW